MGEDFTEPGRPGDDPSGEAAERVSGHATESTGDQASETSGGQAAAGVGMQDGPAGNQAQLLGELSALRRRARTGRHAYWFPLVLFGALTCASVPFYISSPVTTGAGEIGGGQPRLPALGGFPGFLVRNYLAYYWLAALAVGLLATLLWYRTHARRVGLQTPARGYVITGAVLTILAVVVPLFWPLPGDLVLRGTFPFLIIAAGLWVLARAERSVALTVIAAVYTATALLASLYDLENVLFRLGWNPAPSQWDLTLLPNVLLPALVLLAAGAGAFLVQRRHQSAA